MSTLAFIISNFCGFKDPNLTKEYKEQCLNFMVNCSIINEGVTTNEQIDFCREEWVEKAKSL